MFISKYRQINPDSSNICFDILVVSRFNCIVYYMNPCIVLFLGSKKGDVYKVYCKSSIVHNNTNAMF